MTIELIKKIEKDIQYYSDYKNNLCQYIIHNSSYCTNTKLHNRKRLKSHEMLGLLKEIQEISNHIYLLKLLFKADINTFQYIINNYLK